ncbi:MAG: AAA-like domain-containing protein [Cyanobacteria bacterium J06592_8]
MADSIKASKQGLEIVDRARRNKGWKKQAEIWCETANTSLGTLKRFWKGAPIHRQTFINICNAVEANWKEVMEYEGLSRSEVYIERPPMEASCYSTLLQPGSLLRIKAPRHTGKTSLIGYILTQLNREGYRIANLSLKLAERSHFANLDIFLRWFCTVVSKELKLPILLKDYWEEDTVGSKANCTTYFEEYLLVENDNPVILAIDDVDLVFPYMEIYEDFFALLRFWHERAKSRPLWERFRLVVAYSTEVYVPLNINQSPFNVGISVELPELSVEQVQQLASLYGLDWNISQVQQLMEMIGGHPYLLKLACNYLKENHELTLAQLLELAPQEAGIYSQYLLSLLLELQQDKNLVNAFRTIVNTEQWVQLEPVQTYRLNRMGLIQLSGNKIKPRCQLYRQYFRTHLTALVTS